MEFDPEVWSAIAASATVLILALSLVFARSQVKEARRMREQQTRPYVVVDFDASDLPIVDIVISNLGNSIARDVTFDFDPPLERVFDRSKDSTPLSEASLFKGGIPTLPPKKSIRLFFDMSFDVLNAGVPTSYDVIVRYKDFRGKRLPPDTYTLDLELYRDIGQIDRGTLHDVAKHLDSIQQQISRWTKDLNGVNVYVTDARAKDRRSWRWIRSQDRIHKSRTSILRKWILVRNRVMDRFGW